MTKVYLTKNLTRPVLTEAVPGGYNPGDDNPLWNRLVYMMLQRVFGHEVLDGSQYLTIDGIDDLVDLSISQVKNLAAVGCEVLDYPAFVELASAQMSQDVPSVLTNPYQEDGVTLKTWTEWANGNERQNGGTYYVELNGGGRAEPGSTLRELENTHGYTLRSVDEVQDLV